MIDFSKFRLMVLAPHADDEVLMAGGLMQKVSKTLVIPFAVKSDRYREMLEAASVLKNCEVIHPISDKDRLLFDELPVADTISILDEYIRNFKPDIMVVPKPSHHQDHQYTHKVGLAACRPSAESPIKLILIGSYPYDDVYPVGNVNSSYLYVRLSLEEFNIKMRAIQCHRSQMRDQCFDPMYLINLKTIGRMRGMEAMYHYAERFEILRMIS